MDREGGRERVKGGGVGVRHAMVCVTEWVKVSGVI